MSGFRHTQRIEIEAPDAGTAFALERRLAHLSPTAVGAGLGWVVALEDAEDRLEEIEAVVRHWLRDVDLGATLVHVDGATRTVIAHAVDEPYAGYESGPVLTHEP